jgi:hypothetical protein
MLRDRSMFREDFVEWPMPPRELASNVFCVETSASTILPDYFCTRVTAAMEESLSKRLVILLRTMMSEPKDLSPGLHETGFP